MKRHFNEEERMDFLFGEADLQLESDIRKAMEEDQELRDELHAMRRVLAALGEWGEGVRRESPDSDVVNFTEAAAFLKISEEDLAQGLGQIPHQKIGSKLRFSRQALAEWMSRQKPAEPSQRKTGNVIDFDEFLNSQVI